MAGPLRATGRLCCALAKMPTPRGQLSPTVASSCFGNTPRLGALSSQGQRVLGPWSHCSCRDGHSGEERPPAVAPPPPLTLHLLTSSMLGHFRVPLVCLQMRSPETPVQAPHATLWPSWLPQQPPLSPLFYVSPTHAPLQSPQSWRQRGADSPA